MEEAKMSEEYNRFTYNDKLNKKGFEILEGRIKFGFDMEGIYTILQNPNHITKEDLAIFEEQVESLELLLKEESNAIRELISQIAERNSNFVKEGKFSKEKKRFNG